MEGTAVEVLDAYCERGIPGSLTQPACLVWTIIRGHVSSTGACERPWRVSDVVGRCGEVALGEGRHSPAYLGRRRDPGQPGETIAIPIKTGEQLSLAPDSTEFRGKIPKH